jgi:hypothetical protein
MYHQCQEREGRRSSINPKRVCTDACREREIYGLHQDPRNPGEHSGGGSPRCLQVIYIK